MQGHVTGESPWRGMSLPKAKPNGTPNGTSNGTSTSAEKRAFTDPELSALLTAPDVSPLLKDAMRVALLTGARIEELCGIRVGDVKLEGPIPFIDLRGQKTEAARRAPCPSTPT